MKSTQTFTEFYTQFLHLAGKARIPTEDWHPDLYDKLTVSLQTAVLPIFETLSSYQVLADRCHQLDQELKCIKEWTDRFRARQATAANQNALNKTPECTAATNNTPTSLKPRLTYDDPNKQTLSCAGACFTCYQPGHLARNCPMKAENNVIEGKEEDKDEGEGIERP